MEQQSGREDSVQVLIPRKLEMSILKVRVADNIDWNSACLKAADLVDTNSEGFKKAVEQQAQNLYKSRHMSELDKARTTIYNGAFNDGAENVRRTEQYFTTPCSKCGKPVSHSNKDVNWEENRSILGEAFKNWQHAKCP